MSENTTKDSSFKRRLGYASKGISKAWQRESSFRIQTICALLVLIFCLIFRPPAIWCALFATNIAIVLGLELLNSALEALMDLLHPNQHSEIGFIKDCLAGAVLVSSFGSVIVFILFVVSKWL
jgi:diacylglycerol kinase